MALPPINNAYGQGPQLRMGEKIRVLEKALKKMKYYLDRKERELQEANAKIAELEKATTKSPEKVSENKSSEDMEMKDFETKPSENGRFVDPVTGKEYKSVAILKGVITKREKLEAAKAAAKASENDA